MAAATVLAGEIAITPFVTLNKKLLIIWNPPKASLRFRKPACKPSSMHVPDDRDSKKCERTDRAGPKKAQNKMRAYAMQVLASGGWSREA